MPPTAKKNPLQSPLSFIDKIALLEARQGRKIIRFDLAEPHFTPPEAAIEGTISAIKQGKYKYGPSRGLPELISGVGAYLSDTRGLGYGANELLITTGGKFANYAFFASLFERGDRVVLIKPYWTSFGEVPEMLGLNKIEVWSNEPYHIDAESLLSAMSKRPKAIVVNTPNNPTGGILNETDLRLLRDVAVDYDLLVLSDEIDWAYTFDGRRHISPASLPGLRERTVVTDGFSKIFSMTGWRVGFAAGPEDIITRMHRIQEHSVSSPTTFAQFGCLEALKSSGDYIPNIRKACDSRRVRVVRALEKIRQLNCPIPEGGFYAYPKVRGGVKTDGPRLCERLLAEAGVSVIPGTFFGDTRPTFRLCYAVEDCILDDGLNRIVDFFVKESGDKKRKNE